MTFDDSTVDKLIFRADRHCHPMHESEQVLQRKAAISRKYHAQVCHARLAHGLLDHERTRTRIGTRTRHPC
jgi:hypothetical protein